MAGRFVLCWLVPASACFALYGHVTRDTVWADTVLITGDVVVDSNVTLSIVAGTHVICRSCLWDYPERDSGWVDLFVLGGRLIARGTRQESITFRPDSGPACIGVRLRHADAELKHVSFTDFFDGGLRAEECGTITVDSSEFRYMGASQRAGSTGPWEERRTFGIVIRGADSVRIADCTFSHIWGWDGVWEGRASSAGWAIDIASCSHLTLASDSIYGIRGGNASTDWVWDAETGGGITCVYSDSVALKDVTIINVRGGSECEWWGGAGGDAWGIDMQCSDLQMRRVKVVGVTGGPGLRSNWSGLRPVGDAFGIKVWATSARLESLYVDACYGGDGGNADYPSGSATGLSLGWVNGSLRRSWVMNAIRGRPAPSARNGRGVGISVGRSATTIGGAPSAQNNIYGHSDYALVNTRSGDVNACYNYWGVDTREAIELRIRDHQDDSSLGGVYFEPWAHSPVMSVGEESPTPALPVSRLLAVRPALGSGFVIRLNAPPGLGVSVQILDISGRVRTVVREGVLPPGAELLWDDPAAPPGVYFCRAVVGSQAATVKLVKVE